MSATSQTNASINKDGAADIATPPGAMHGPHHSPQDTEEVAAHDEVQHDAALRESSLRVPR
ncbi:hypothetical protein [Dyella sp. 2HG41-7]|uniref:hypothetical protein n=1 Tax=Dyella sp. 2HG41-7 TaxID=2883239 RepID=UPI001F2D74E5|nr:hypothetical protein [Dyella sp. 2HG41-7]